MDVNQTILERAHASEMLEEMEKVVEAASTRGKSSLAWINWDVMADAAVRGVPRPTETLSTTSKARLGVGKANDRASAVSLTLPYPLITIIVIVSSC